MKKELNNVKKELKSESGKIFNISLDHIEFGDTKRMNT